MSGPYCETCIHFGPCPIGRSDGECTDPDKIIYAGKGDRLNEHPSVGTKCECSNHTPADIKPFSVTAGSYDGFTPNCKYSDQFETLDQAIEAYDKVAGYPWLYIEYKGRVIELWDKDAGHPLRE